MGLHGPQEGRLDFIPSTKEAIAGFQADVTGLLYISKRTSGQVRMVGYEGGAGVPGSARASRWRWLENLTERWTGETLGLADELDAGEKGTVNGVDRDGEREYHQVGLRIKEHSFDVGYL